MSNVRLTVKIWAFWLENIMHGANYRDGTGQVFTRKEYIKGKPQIKIAKFQGGKRGTYQHCVQLLLNEKIQIRHMAIESTKVIIQDLEFIHIIFLEKINRLQLQVQTEFQKE
jgi:hypothetical protein